METPFNQKHINIKLGGNYRIVVISDIHAHSAVFDKLLAKVALKDDDYLVILGDFINKGPDSLGATLKMMTLAKRPRTFILKGNHELFIDTYLRSQQDFPKMYDFIKANRYPVILHDIARALNYDVLSNSDSEAFRKAVLKEYADTFNFIHTRPIILECEDFIFVHGGYDKALAQAMDEDKLLKYDDFNTYSPVQDKTVVVGHWPTSNLRHDIHTNMPYFNDDKHIVFVDGGLGVKSSGELNALIISAQDHAISYKTVQANHFTKASIIKTHHFQKEKPIFVNYPHFNIDVLQHGKQFNKCLHRHSGVELSVFNSLLEKGAEGNFIKVVYINRFFNLSVGDTVEVVQRFDDCVSVKHKGEFGWILPEQIEHSPV